MGSAIEVGRGLKTEALVYSRKGFLYNSQGLHDRARGFNTRTFIILRAFWVIS